ncbi:MAG: ketoacyl-ACP synthase III [Acetobacteraceae bacterium]|nr:ketoacyl-ACP synthase III [Acetobacteraceae bacterium]
MVLTLGPGVAEAPARNLPRGLWSSRFRPVGIAGVGVAVGERVLTNHDLERMVDTTDEWIRTRTGIVERRLVAPGQAASDLATSAARQALEQAGLEPDDLDLIIVATVTPDTPFPATSCLVQRNLEARRAAAFDLSVGCTGFIYGLSVGSQFVSSGRYSAVLVIGVEVLSSIVDWTDRNTCVLFGDGAGAAVLRPASEGMGILAIHLGSDGRGADLLKLPAGGSRLPASAETVARRLHYVQMEGSEVFKFAVKVMAQASLGVLRRCGLKRSDIDLLIPHQANLRIIEAAAERLGVPWDRVVVNIHRYGNMSSASIPVALGEALAEGRVREGDVILMVAFGAGLSWASCVMRWEDVGRTRTQALREVDADG